jgi:ferredoxin
MRRKRLQVDPVACDAYGYCTELLPELIGVDEWGYPIVSAQAVPPQLLELARKAVADCPRRALALVEPAEAGPPAPAKVRLATSRAR